MSRRPAQPAARMTSTSRRRSPVAPTALGEQPARLALLRAHLAERGLQVGHLSLEQTAVLHEHDQELVELRLGVARRLVHVDKLLDLGQRQAETLAAQRELEAGAV